MAIQTIVAALALETDNDPVVQRALQLARQHRARLIFVHALENIPQDTEMPMLPDLSALHKIIKQEAKRKLETLSNDAEIIIEAAKPYHLIKTVADQNSADIVIIGQGNARNIRERIFGSTADRVVRQSTVAVLVVKTAAAHPYQRIIAAIDFSESAGAAAETVACLAPHADFEAVHVLEISLIFEQAMLKSGTSRAEIDRYYAAKAMAARKQLEAALSEMKLGEIRPKLRIINGSPSEVLIRLSQDKMSSVMALGARGHNALSQALIGSHAQRLLREAACDILIVNNRH